jgi:hypothetical protein
VVSALKIYMIFGAKYKYWISYITNGLNVKSLDGYYPGWWSPILWLFRDHDAMVAQ